LGPTRLARRADALFAGYPATAMRTIPAGSFLFASCHVERSASAADSSEWRMWKNAGYVDSLPQN